MTPLVIQAEREANGPPEAEWVRHGVDLGHVFEGWPQAGRQAVMEL